MKTTIFLYNKDFKMSGRFCSLPGYRLAADPCHDKAEILESPDDCVYGRLVEVDDFTLNMMDTYYCTGLHVYERITVLVRLKGGKGITVQTYKFNIEEPVK